MDDKFSLAATLDEGDIDIDIENTNYKMVSISTIEYYSDNPACMRAIQMYSCTNGVAFLLLYLLHSCVYIYPN